MVPPILDESDVPLLPEFVVVEVLVHKPSFQLQHLLALTVVVVFHRLYPAFSPAKFRGELTGQKRLLLVAVKGSRGGHGRVLVDAHFSLLLNRLVSVPGCLHRVFYSGSARLFVRVK